MSSQKQDPPHPSPKLDLAAGDLEKSPHTPVDTPTNDSSDDHVTPASLSDLFRYSTKFELFLDSIGLICAAAAGAAQRANDEEGLEAAKAHFRHVAAKDAMWLTIMGIGLYGVTHIFMLIWTYTGEVNSKRIRERYLRAVLRQEIAFFDKLGAGEVTTRIQTDTHLIQQGISEKVPLIVMCISAFFTGFAVAYARSWRLALALTSIVPCMAITGKTMGSFVSKYKQLALSEIAAGANLAEEVISTIRTSQAFGTQRTLAAVYDTFATKVTALENKIAIARCLALGIMFFILYATYSLAFYYGTTLILQGRGDAGLVVNVFLAIMFGAISLNHMAPEVEAVSAGRAAAAKVFATIDRVPPIDSADEGGTKLEKVTGHIRFENVLFNYPARPDVPVLTGLNLDIPPGTNAALVGASGSGKSTVVALVERFYDPLSGAVKLDGVNVKELNVKWLRQQIGLVQQEPCLFSTTIRGNVAHGLIGSRFENEPEEEKFRRVQEACRKANAHSFIQKLPQGYDTLVGERGFLLSGGQKQRIAIARAIVSDPRILLLDEATSALDTQSEALVQDALDKAAAGRTTITIAHRLSTIRDADRIYVIGNGGVLEQGTHAQLLANSEGAYAQLVSAQKLQGQESDSEASGNDGKTTGGLMTEAEIEATVAEEVPEALKRTGTRRSIASEVLERKQRDNVEAKDDHSLFYLLKRMALIGQDDMGLYILGTLGATAAGLIYPAFGIVYAKAMDGFSLQDRHALRHEGDRNALWMFIVALLAAASMAIQSYYFTNAAAGLVEKLTCRSFRAMLKQEIGWFDEDRHSSGRLVSLLSDNPAKISGLAGLTLAAIIQSVATVIGGAVIGFVFAPKLGAVGLGYIRLRIIVLKDQVNREAHQDSAQLACEAAGAVRTVQSLTRENDCYTEYSRSLEEPLRRSNRSSVFSTGLFAVSQGMGFWAIALVRD
ncbi:GTPase-activating protein [Tulasnella sp. 408]|nr:GTPase-activating protein [Tulasnella sp. 408]